MSRILILALATITISLTTGGCADDACSDLSDICGSCTNDLVRESCEATVALDDADACQNALDDPNTSDVCPGG